MTNREKHKLFVVAGVGFVLWNVALKYLYAIQRLIMQVYRITFPQTNTAGVEMDLWFLVKNPTSISLTFSGFRGKVFLNDTEITDVAIPRQTIFPNLSQIRLCFWLSWEQLGKNIVPELLTTSLADSILTIDGDLKVMDYTIPIKYSIPVNQLTNA